MTALNRVTRWSPQVKRALDRHGLQSLPLWAALAQIDVEGDGYTRPEAHVEVDYSAEGLLQLQPIAAEDCGVSVEQIDGLGRPWVDAYRAIDCYGKLQAKYNGSDAPIWDYVLLWKAGSGTLSTSRSLRDELDYWSAWHRAVEQSDNLRVNRVFGYARKWLDLVPDYIRWQYGGQG